MCPILHMLRIKNTAPIYQIQAVGRGLIWGHSACSVVTVFVGVLAWLL